MSVALFCAELFEINMAMATAALPTTMTPPTMTGASVSGGESRSWWWLTFSASFAGGAAVGFGVSSDAGGGDGGAASVSVPAGAAAGGAGAGAAEAVFAKRAMAFSPASTVTLSVSVAPSGPLNFTVCAPGSTTIGSASGVGPGLVTVDGDLGARGGRDVDASELRVRLVRPSFASARCLSVMSLLSVRNCLKYVLGLERVPALQAAPREVEQHRRVLLQRVRLEERGARLLELALVVEADALLEAGARHVGRGVVRGALRPRG